MVKKLFMMFFCSLMALAVLGMNSSKDETSELAEQNLQAINSGRNSRAFVQILICYCTFDGEGSGSKTAYDCGNCEKVNCVTCTDQSKCAKG